MRSDFYPAPKCVLSHWYELRASGDPIGPDNNKRLTQITSMQALARRHGLGALRGAVLAAVWGKRPMEPCFLPIGSSLFYDEVDIERAVLNNLNIGEQPLRIAATYASIFFLDKEQEVASTLSELVVLAREHRLVIQAAHEALDIWMDTKSGGRCRRCGLTGTPRGTLKQLAWAPQRVL